MSEFDCDVLIVGAGPVGTALALELALHKVSFRIIDQLPVRSDKSKALVVQPRTLELLNRYGDAHEYASRGRLVRGTELNFDRKHVTIIRLSDAAPEEAEFPHVLMVSQAETERFLDGHLARFGASVDRPAVAKSITQDATGVSTEIERPGGVRETIRSKYIVGCDGAHSFVRRSAKNLTFDGATYPEEFTLCDAKIRDSNVTNDVLSVNIGSGLLAVLPLGNGRVRLIAAPAQNKQVKLEGEPTLEYFQALIDKFCVPGGGTLYDPEWMSLFRLHHRGVNKYRDGRIFVGGDAAHIHSPAGGQGMNTGIQDSINLGWKLAAALQGRVADPEALLDSYHAERHPVGLQLLRETDRLFTFAASTKWLFVRVRNFIAPWILPWVWSSMYRTRIAYQYISELGIKYRGSPIVGTALGFQGPIAGGYRVPDGELKKIASLSGDEAKGTTRVHHLCVGARHHLLLFPGSGKTEDKTAVAASSADLEEASDKIGALVTDDMKTHVIWSGSPSELSGRPLLESSYLDVDGVYARFGFEKEAGYVLTRPDGYIAHIGPLSRLSDCEAWAERFF